MKRENTAETTWLTDEDYRAFKESFENPAQPTSYLINAIKNANGRVVFRGREDE